MEQLPPSFSFVLAYADHTVDCEIIMQADGYAILFDGRPMGHIAHTDAGTWIQSAGVILPESIIAQIGDTIESEYQ